MRTSTTAAIVAAVLLAAGCTGDPSPTQPTGTDPAPAPGPDAPYRDASLPIDARVANLLSLMTQEEKFGQMTQVEHQSLRPGDVAGLQLGSVLHGGGAVVPNATVEDWSQAVTAVQREAVDDTRLGIPIVYGIDAVHGFGSMNGATVFPHQIGMGAAGDPDLVERVGRATAEEVTATGIRWVFGPVLGVSDDVRWGRTYEVYSQDADAVAELGAAAIRGMQGDGLASPTSVLATPKHFIGDASTVFGTSSTFGPNGQYLIDQGDAPADPALLAELLVPYEAAIDEGARSMMASFSSWGGEKVHGSGDLLTDTLRGDLGFDGFVVSDWAGCDQIDFDSYDAAVASCINAGVDMVMTPYDGAAFQDALAAGVANGGITQGRIDEAVTRILTVKMELGLFENPYPDPAAAAVVGSDEHRALAREAVQKSQVLLKNDGALPIPASAKTIAVVGPGADDMGMQAGGWTASWQGSRGAVIPGTTIIEGIRDRAGSGVTVLDELPATGKADVCVAVIGEPPYAEGVGDSATLEPIGGDTVDSLQGKCRSTVLVVVSGRPVIVTEYVPRADAVVASWLPGTAGEGVADVLFGDAPFTGALPVDWPADISHVPAGGDSLWPAGFGLDTSS